MSQAKPLESTPRNLSLEGSDPETEKSWFRFMAKAERTVINVGPSIFRTALDPFLSEVWLFSFWYIPYSFK